MRPKVSVIVPVYKVEKYLDRCLESIVNQNLKEIEIILIDDGSPDQCGQMCEDWGKRDSRIKVVHKKNEGLGFARNSGLDIATGEYVSFVDSDDYIAIDAYQKLYPIMKSTDADLCYFGYILVKADGTTLKKLPSYQKIFSEQEIKDELLIKTFGETSQRKGNEYIICSVWSALYQLDFLNKHHLRFWSEREWLCEDVFFNLHTCYYARKAVVIEEAPYFYCQNNGSLTRNYRVDRFEKSQNMYLKLLEMANQMGLREEAHMRAATTFLINVIVCLKQEIAFLSQHGLVRMYGNIKKICNEATLKKVFSTYPIIRMPLKQKILFGCMKYDWTIMVIFLNVFKQFSC